MPAGITIVGLGPGDPELITQQAWRTLSEASEVYLRTGEHPARQGLPAGIAVRTFDTLYETSEDFAEVYRAIVTSILDLARRPEGVVYAVPGDPTVGEATVARLRDEAAAAGLPVRLIHGLSFVEPCLALVGYDALDGLSVADALELAAGYHPLFPADVPALIGQLHSALIASDVKLTLMGQYPDEHPVRLLHGAGGAAGRVEEVPLHAMDRSRSIGAMTALWVPPLPQTSSLERFQETVAHLRAPDGCPWDREQTHASLRPHVLEEAYEVLQALDRDDMPALQEELGDLLLQIVLQAQIAAEEGTFRLADVIAGINAKIIRRHPHVFGDVEVAGVEDVLHNWEAFKEAERQEEGQGKGLLDGVPEGLPALAQAAELQARVARVGFDWPGVDGILDKVTEEVGEIQRAGDEAERRDEVGDLLFTLVNYARRLGIDAEGSLRTANGRFRRRFKRLEQAAGGQARPLREMNLQEMDALWEAAKEDERGGG